LDSALFGKKIRGTQRWYVALAPTLGNNGNNAETTEARATSQVVAGLGPRRRGGGC